MRREQVRLGCDPADRYQRIANEKFVSRLHIDQQQQQTVLELVNEQQALERQATSIRRDAQIEQSLQELPAQRAGQIAATDRDRALIRQERIQQETGGEQLIKAPVAGLMASRLIEPGRRFKLDRRH